MQRQAQEVYDMTLNTPFNMIIAGASGSGKTAKLTTILKYKDIILYTTTKKVIFSTVNGKTVMKL